MAESEGKIKHVLSNAMAEKIQRVNQRLRDGRMGVAIAQLRKRLYLIATLPPKPGSEKQHPHQQRISLGIPANPAGLATAEAEAKRLGGLLATRTFRWELYLKQPRKAETVADWLSRYEAEFKGQVAPVTWETDYHKAFVKLPHGQPLTTELLQRVLMTTQPDTKTRRRCALAFGRLAAFAGLEGDFKGLRGNYTAATVEPRDLPDDATIAEWWNRISNPGWRWVYGMIATFGLRSHECFFLDVDQFQSQGHMVAVTEGKTGARLIWACYPEWVERFQLRDRVLPNVTGKEHTDYTRRVGKYFKQTAKLPFTALDLRHRWAVRTLEFGLSHELAAKQMGHSVPVHERTYHRWITAETHQQAYDALMMRSDRPLPPS
jgi:integrase